MSGELEERYPGEARGLALFLARIAPLVRRELGGSSMLARAVERALATRSLGHLRQARRLFNRLPGEIRRRLVGEALARDTAQRTPRGCVAFVMSEERAGAEVLFRDGQPEADLLLLVRPGVLPSAAARRLRELADAIEGDRRLLSERFWLERAMDADGEGGDRHRPHR